MKKTKPIASSRKTARALAKKLAPSASRSSKPQGRTAPAGARAKGSAKTAPKTRSAAPSKPASSKAGARQGVAQKNNKGRTHAPRAAQPVAKAALRKQKTPAKKPAASPKAAAGRRSAQGTPQSRTQAPQAKAPAGRSGSKASKIASSPKRSGSKPTPKSSATRTPGSQKASNASAIQRQRGSAGTRHAQRNAPGKAPRTAQGSAKAQRLAPKSQPKAAPKGTPSKSAGRTPSSVASSGMKKSTRTPAVRRGTAIAPTRTDKAPKSIAQAPAASPANKRGAAAKTKPAAVTVGRLAPAPVPPAAAKPSKGVATKPAAVAAPEAKPREGKAPVSSSPLPAVPSAAGAEGPRVRVLSPHQEHPLSAAKQHGVAKHKLTTPAAPVALQKHTKIKAVGGSGRSAKLNISEEAKAFMLSARKRTSTPVIFKIRKRSQTPIVFTLDEVRDLLQKRKSSTEEAAAQNKASLSAKLPAGTKVKTTYKPTGKTKPPVSRVLAAASLSDILGYNPEKSKPTTAADEEAAKIPPKFKPYYTLLVKLRNQLKTSIDLHAHDSLRRSNKEESGELSSYGQHMADAGTDTFDQEFALSLLSGEQEALMEIDEAIQRMVLGTYGVCEVTGKPIGKERLMAVPFTRCSVEGQEQLERQRRRSLRSGQTAALFNEILEEEGPRSFGDEDGR